MSQLISFSNRLITFLAHEIIFSIILFGMIGVLSAAFRKKSPYWQLGLWTLLLIRLFLPPNLSSPISVRNLANKYLLKQSEYAAEDFVMDYSLSSISEENLALNGDDDKTASKPISWQFIFASIWFMGFLASLFLYLKRLNHFRKIIRNSTDVIDENVTCILHRWKHQFRINRRVRVVTSNSYLSPFTIGIFKPDIFIPRAIVTSADFVATEAIIAHEMAHIKRFDDFWIKLQMLVQIVYFFHPVVWYANSRINLARESICDSLVLSQNKIIPKKYGQGILNVLKLNLLGSDFMEPVPSFGKHKKKMEYRIANIKEGKIMKKNQPFIIFAVIALIGIFTIPMALSKTDVSEKADVTSVKEESPVKFYNPIPDGKFVSGFGERVHPISGEKHFHNAVDIAAKIGSNVIAAQKGTVIKVGYDETAGNHIIIQHDDNFTTVYTKLDSALIKENQEVSSKEIIALSGNTGISTGPHLHFEIRKDGKAVDPEKFITFKK